ncbi:hypothetical protein Barb6XT_02888 [Bacteroidales bacterium Barb6XT]|nr:hypothetical protein Barb6XT_02888 [Bacteroidales bacterium Barb6XT]
MNSIGVKLRENFPQMVILKDHNKTDSIFTGRNLPSFVKDYLLKKHLDGNGNINKYAISSFLELHLPSAGTDIKTELQTMGKTILLLTRFIVVRDLKKNMVHFSIPDLGISLKEGIIPDYVARTHSENLSEGEKWGVIKLTYNPPEGKDPGYIMMTDYKPFKPYSVSLDYFRNSRKNFDLKEWVDVLITAMEYEPDGFINLTQKVEFISRLLIFVEPRLNLIELAPKGTGKSYVFGNLSKYGWLVSGGKITRAKLFYDKSRQQTGIISNYDFVALDEIQTIIFQEPAELQAALKSYLESGKTSIDNTMIMSECGMMLMGNIPLSESNKPLNKKFFASLPDAFRESALLDRFHGFIEGWKLPRMNKSMVLNGWTLDVEYFSEILHAMRTASEYATIVNDLVVAEKDSDLRDLKAVRRIATAYMKLLFPHWTSIEEVNKEEFNFYCLQPAIRRRGIIKEQCHLIDEEFKEEMPEIYMK